MDQPASSSAEAEMFAVRARQLDSFFEATTVAVIGASDREFALGGRPLKYATNANPSIEVFPVNPRRTLVQGRRSFPSVAAIPQQVDLAIIALSTEFVAGALDECISAGIRCVVVITSGFAELGPQGRDAQQALVEKADAAGVLLLGPGSIGHADLERPLILYGSGGFDKRDFLVGPVGFASQSGAIGAVVYHESEAIRLGFRRFVSTGLEGQLGTVDFLASFIEDERIDAAGAYLEGIRDPNRLVELLRKAVALEKPLCVLRGGKSPQGQVAATSHTAALNRGTVVVASLLAQFGVREANDPTHLADLLMLATSATPPEGRRCAVITVSGGAGIVLTDLLTEAGLDVPELDVQTSLSLDQVLPSYAVSRNPIDVTAQVTSEPELIAHALGFITLDPAIDVVIVYFGFLDAVSDDLVEAILEAKTRSSVPIIVVWTAITEAARRRLRQDGVAVFDALKRCVDAVDAFTQASVLKMTDREVIARETAPPRPQAMIAPKQLPGTILDEHHSRKLLASDFFAAVPERFVASAEEAAGCVREMRTPLVLKACAEDVPHKAALGLVRLNLGDESSARSAFDAVRSAALKADLPHAKYVLQEQVSGVELFVGATIDDDYGRVLLIGAGGLDVERRKQVHRFVGDVSLGYIERVLSMPDLWRGWGLSAPGPEASNILAQGLGLLGNFAEDNRESVLNVEINPLIFTDQCKFLMADALVSYR